MSKQAGSVYQRSDGKWCAALMADGKRKVLYAKSEREARKKLADIQNTLATNGTLPNPGNRTVNDLLDLWLESAELRPGTLADYRSVLTRYVRPSLGHVKLSRLEPIHIQNLCGSLRAKGLTRTPHLVYSLLHRALALSVLWGWLPVNPCDRIVKPQYRAERKEMWTKEELYTFLQGAQEHRLYPLWIVALSTGCRIGELSALRWDDVDLANGIVTIRRSARDVNGEWVEGLPKTKAGIRSLSIPAEGLIALRRQKAQQNEWRLKAGQEWQDGSLVFTTATGTPLDRSGIEHALYRQCERLGVRKISPHSLRHLHASLLFAGGLPVPAVSARLGHANPSITLQVYSHALNGQDQQAASVMDSVLAVSR